MEQRPTDPAQPRRPALRWLARLTLAAVSAVIAATGAVVLLVATGIVNRSTLELVYLKWFGADPIGIWQSDPVFGWSHRPSSSGRQRRPPDFDVRYQIDAEGHRVTGGDPNAPRVLVLGDSFTFGVGVRDRATYPALLQRSLADYRVVNAAAMGWGTTHAWLKLQQQLELHPDTRLVIYGFITHHVERNWRRWSWLKTLSIQLDRRNPMVDIEDGPPVFRGLADPDRDGLPASSALDRAEAEATVRLLEDMVRRCDERGIPMVVAYLPDGSSPPTPEWLQPILDRLAARGQYLDLRTRIAYREVKFPRDGHLNLEGHRRVAEELLPVVRGLFGPAHGP